MATIATLIARIEERIALASGLDTQVHGEARLLEMLRHSYNMFFDHHWWYDYLTFENFTVEATTKTVTGSVSDRIRRFIDIHSVFYENDPYPLSITAIGTNPAIHQRPAIQPYSADMNKVFRILPITVNATVGVWYRTRLSDAQWEDQDNGSVIVNMDDELLIVATAFDYLTDEGINDDAAAKYKGQMAERLDRLAQLEFQQPINKRSQHLSIPSTWMEGPPY